MPAAAQTPSYQALYRACMKEAAAQGRTLMQRLVVRAGESMPRRAAMAPDERERKLLTDAVRTLMKHERALCEAYPQVLLAEFAQAISGDPGKPAGLSFDALELMGDEQMHESVELMRMQQAVMSNVEAELSELNTLVCAVQGFKNVQADRNPLRPEVYIRSLRNVALQSPVPAAVRSRWIQHLGEALGPELARVYQELASSLRAQGVVGARFTAVPTPESNPAINANTAAATSGGGVPASTLLNLEELRRLLSGHLDDADAVAIAPNAGRVVHFSGTVPAALEALEEMKQVDRVVQRLKQRQAGHNAAGPDAVQAQLRSQARGTGQALGLEVVNLMVENIANDPRLLPPVQQTVRDLEPALLRLALDDPRFFSDRKHAARRLLEQMTQRSLAWDAVDAPGFAAFLEPLQQAVEVLVSTRIGGAEPFDFALKTLEEAWGNEEKRDRHYREKAVRALLQAEQRNLLAEKIAREMRNRADVSAASREVVGFLTGPWTQVMAQARLGDAAGATDPGGYAGLVADLLWSTQPRLAGANTGRLAKLVPELVKKIRHGLATIDYPPAWTQRFLDHLSAAHQQALGTGGPSGRPVPLSTSMSREELEAMLGADEEGQGRGIWLVPTEAQHSGFMHTHQSVVPRPLFQETSPGYGDTRAPANELGAGLPEVALQPGAWVEMMLEDGWSRYQVTWASPHATLFMFAGGNGKPHSMTRRLLGKMLQSGTMRMISGQPVVDGALDAVAQAALRNSIDLKL